MTGIMKTKIFFFDDVDEYCEEKSGIAKELKEFTKDVLCQVHFD